MLITYKDKNKVQKRVFPSSLRGFYRTVVVVLKEFFHSSFHGSFRLEVIKGSDAACIFVRVKLV